ncbi:MAG: B12-binding domain-containing radical SAM protein [Deltaproteobacteria bacterium]|nr:B12-binding domain-containing radical SAM protein [Deltaproteobacteria bacterium]
MVLRDIKRRAPGSARSHAVSSATDRKLILVNPVNADRTGMSHNRTSRFAPLSLGIIAALTPKRFDIEIIDENIAPFQYRDADLVGITTFTSSAARGYDIAAKYREHHVPVVMGGIHASMQPKEALCHVDTVVTGEAEGVWPGLIEDFMLGKLKRLYSGQPPTLDNLPFPGRDLFDQSYLFATVQTSRGCPMNCAFCSVTAFNGGKRRERPVEDVLDEIACIPNRQLFFVDDNIAGNSAASMDRAQRLFQGMVERRLDKTWFCQASVHIATNDILLHWARKAGCRMIFLGLETQDPAVLTAMNKKGNIGVDYKKALRNIRRHRIAVLGAFINGTPGETRQRLEQKADDILQLPMDVIQATVMTPLPGTQFFKTLESQQKLLYTDFPADWAKYDMGALTFRLDQMSYEAFTQQHHLCNRRFYSRFNVVRRFFYSLAHTKSIEAAIWAYNSNMNYRNIALHKKM